MMRRTASVLTISVLVANLAAAAEEAAHEGSPHEGSAARPLLFSTINFALFVYVLYRYAWPSVRTFLRERHDRIVQLLRDAAAAKAEAERLRTEWELRLAKVEDEIAARRQQANADAERERERILAAAYKTAETIRHDAERTAAAEVRRVQEMLRAELVHGAVQIAENATRKSWTAEDQKRAVGKFLERVRP